LAGAKVMSAEAKTFDFTVETRYFITAREFAESGVGVAIVDPPSPLYSERFNLTIRPFPGFGFDGARAAEAAMCQVRLVAAEINEKLVLFSHFGRAEYLQGK
jgi:hypothetical protein